jgi:hypothetical protein
LPNAPICATIASVVEHWAVGPYGAKGIHKISSIPRTLAITNVGGVRVLSLPMDQDELLLSMRLEQEKRSRRLLL